MRSERIDWKMLFLGMFSLTQITLIGKIGISEIIVLLAAPIVYFRNQQLFKRDGVNGFLLLCFLWLGGAIFADLFNHVTFARSARGLACPIVILGTVVYLYPILRRNPSRFKWLLLGIAISHVITIFAFQRGVAGDLASAGDTAGAIDRVVRYKLFWVNMLTTWLTLPITGWYGKTPKWLACSLLLFLSGYALIGGGGRSAFLVLFVSFILIVMVGKRQMSMLWIKKNFIVLILVLGVGGLCAKGVYKHAAKSGLMGAGELGKYEEQTKEGGGVLKLLMAGRSDFFIGVFCALREPIIGYGSHGADKYNCTEEFLNKYGNASDRKMAETIMRKGWYMDVSAHSHIVTFWAFHGIFGLIFWVYALKLVIDTLRKRMHIMPEMYGYFACVIPTLCWDIPFSPFGLRMPCCLAFVMMLIAKAVERQSSRQGRLR